MDNQTIEIIGLLIFAIESPPNSTSRREAIKQALALIVAAERANQKAAERSPFIHKLKFWSK